jgi:dTDP-glucose 4,6-dehydratase
MRILLTGMAGFVGSHVAEHILKLTDWHIAGLVSFQHKGCPLRIHDDNYDRNRVKLIYHDLRAPITDRVREAIGPVDVVLNVAADSHVDRSITEPRDCISNNVDLMLTMLEYARQVKPRVFLQVSTDEVYGPAAKGHNHMEWEAHLPSNPYSASKAAQEDICFSYWRTYGVPLVLTNTMNIFGERQDPEKFVPLVISKVLNGETVQIHGQDGQPGSRFYLHARNQADALCYLVRSFKWGGPPTYPESDRPARFHVVGEQEIDNLALAQLIAGYIGKPLKYEIVNFHALRPGHDLRYALDGRQIAALGWKAPVAFKDSLCRTIDWALQHPEWLALKVGAAA